MQKVCSWQYSRASFDVCKTLAINKCQTLYKKKGNCVVMKKIMKRAFALVLCTCTIFSLFCMANPTTVSAATYTSTRQVRGSDFTSRPKLAKALDSIFAGNASIYSNKGCTKLVNTKLGTKSVPNNSVTQYVGTYGKSAKNSGTSCWIYANGVYFTLFGEALGSGTPGKNSEKINLNKTSSKTLSYSNMCAWGVNGVGAQIRVGNHSIIVLNYDKSGLTYLDGNGDGKGLVAVRTLTWTQVRNTKAINGTVKYIIQPKAEWMNKLYPCSHSYTSFNLCTECGAVKAKDIRWGYGFGTVRVSDSTGCQIRKSPYSACKGEGYAKFLTNGTRVTVIGLVENNIGNRWYKIQLNDMSIWYVYYERICLDSAAKAIFR